MTIEFVLNVSLLKKIFELGQGQRLDSAMSTICHIVERALQREMDFCSHAFTIVLDICLAQPRLLNRVVRCLLLIARTFACFWRPALAGTAKFDPTQN
jgi:hypothetical protein